MANWFLAVVLLGVGLIILYYAINTSDYTIGRETLASALIIVAVLYLFVNFAASTTTTKDLAVFKQQKAYITQHVPGNVIEDAALTQKKIELNEWLFSAQFNQDRFGILSFFPASIQQESPIP